MSDKRLGPNHLRTVRLSPYMKGKGPTFTLRMFDTGRRDERGQSIIAYRLTQHDAGKRTVLFDGADFAGSPMDADDSDATVLSLMNFLTLKPGDTDDDYFKGYSDVQRAFCDAHADALSVEAFSRFGLGDLRDAIVTRPGESLIDSVKRARSRKG